MHGFRATFAAWAKECTDYPAGVREAALAVAVGGVDLHTVETDLLGAGCSLAENLGLQPSQIAISGSRVERKLHVSDLAFPLDSQWTERLYRSRGDKWQPRVEDSRNDKEAQYG